MIVNTSSQVTIAASLDVQDGGSLLLVSSELILSQQLQVDGTVEVNGTLYMGANAHFTQYSLLQGSGIIFYPPLSNAERNL